MDIIKFLELVPWFSACGVIFVILFVYKHDQDKKLAATGNFYSLSEILEASRICRIFKVIIRAFAALVAATFGFVFKDTNTWFIIGWFIFCLGIGMALEGQLFLSQKNDYISRVVMTTAGTISGASADHFGSPYPHPNSKYRNMVNYSVNGVHYTYICKEAVSSNALIPIGTMVMVHYNSYNPQDAYIDEEIKKAPKFLWTLLPIGAVISLVGALMVIAIFM